MSEKRNLVSEGLNQRKDVHPLWSGLLRFLYRLFGWKLEGEPPDALKYILVIAPHTSNWDFVIMLAMDLIVNLRSVWIGKESLFHSPLGPFFRAVGGVPIDRSSRSNMVDQVVQAFQQSERMVLALTPEGTRRKRDHWKSGFYHIAMDANVPLVFGILDYERRVAGFGPLFMPTGDIQADMEVIRDFFKDMRGKFPENASDIRVVVEEKITEQA
jgi:1-acyl-sn-glycerol-3-phosphate acyltransferase